MLCQWKKTSLPNDGVSCPPIYQTQPNFTLKKLTKNRAAYPEPKAGQLNAGLDAYGPVPIPSIRYPKPSISSLNTKKRLPFPLL